MKGFLSLLLACCVAFMVYCWIAYKFPAVNEVMAYDYNDHSEYVAYVNDPLHLFVIASGESVLSDKAALAKAKSQYHNIMDIWIGVSIVLILFTGWIRSKVKDKHKIR